MASFRKLSLLLALFLKVIIILITHVTSQPQPQPQACQSYNFPNTTNFLACNDLPVLDSSLHWTYHPSSNSIDVAFKKNNANYKRWIAWAINPTSTGMVGSRAFVAFRSLDGTMAAYTSPIASYGTTLEEGSLSFEVHGVSASFEDGTVILYASFQLPGNPKSVNHVWQEGLVSDDDSLRSHALSGANFKSFGRIDFLTGKVSDRDAHKQNSKILIRKMSLLRRTTPTIKGGSLGLLTLHPLPPSPSPPPPRSTITATVYFLIAHSTTITSTVTVKDRIL
ncbi:hypothetical protein K1719_040795 [Acacia pycnantha]|nr:hypothetical protein K1719_040795 [Acacia pycnantha]